MPKARIPSNLCNAKLRGKPGRRCRRPRLKSKTRCALHLGRPPEAPSSPEAGDAILIGAPAWRAKMRAKIARGEAKRFPQGRKRKYLIPRPWRFQLSPEDGTCVLAAMLEHDIRVRGGVER